MSGKGQPTSLELQLQALRPGDHLCCLFESEADLFPVALPFARHGFERGEKVLFRLEPATTRAVLEGLETGGLEPASARDRGQLVVAAVSGCRGVAEAREADEAIAWLAGESRAAAREGYPALRVCVELGARPGAGGLRRQVEYDTRLGGFLAQKRCLAVCLFDRRRVDPSVLMGVLSTHHRIVFDGDVFTNPFSLPPDGFTGRDAVAAALNSRLGNLKALKRLDERVGLLTEALFEAQENERRMISRELHDRVAQDLSTMKITLGTLFDEPGRLPARLHPRMSQLSGLLDRTINAVRDLAYDMRPPGLDDFGIVQSLSMYCDDFAEKTGLPVDFHAAGVGRLPLDDTTQINLYRMVQEGLNNIRKHARARSATVKLVAAHPYILLRIEDDGRGFDVRKRANEIDGEKRMGLRSLEERAKLLGGTMVVKSQPGRGTKIFIKFPFQGPDA